MSANKKLVALAALTLVSGLAHAQSQLKVYGYLEADVGSYKPVTAKGTPSSTTTKVQGGDMMTSFIGFAGSEDLGGGLKAEFTLESFVGNDTGSNIPNQAGQFWSRASWVAVGGEFGRILLGQYDNALFTSGLLYNPFGSSMTFSPTMRHFYDLGSTVSSKGPGYYALSQGDTGWVNSVTYESPTIAGFSGALQFSPKESTSGKDKNSFTGSVAYNAGPLSLMGVYVDGGKSPKVSSSAAVSPYIMEFRAANLGASYDFGVVKAFAQYTKFKYYESSPYAGVTGADIKGANVWQLGLSAPITATSAVNASYGQSKYKAFPGDDDFKSKIFSLGYDYTLSKRTGVFAAVTSEKVTDLSGGRAVAVGVKHTF